MFVDPKEFKFIADLEQHWEGIRDEFRALPRESFDPWVQQNMHGDGWSVFGLYALGERIEGACKLCPLTAKLLEGIPNVSLAGFSLLQAQTHIKPHIGWAKSVYRLHLGLVVPPGCALRVADETRHWEEGKCLVFDDTVEHEAWNNSKECRGTLMLDFARPGITEFSRDSVPEDVRRYAEKLLQDE